jgi:hypothetical protein
VSSMSSATERAPALAPRDASVKDTREMVRKALLAAGPLASLLYIVAVDVVAASLWEGYSRTGGAGTGNRTPDPLIASYRLIVGAHGRDRQPDRGVCLLIAATTSAGVRL